MKLIIKKNNKLQFNLLIEWLIYNIIYTIILIFMCLIFKNTLYIDPAFYGIWGLIASIIIYFLNKTIKPILVWLTLPLTGLTFGLFYPVINIVILNITDIILGKHFNIHGFGMSFLIAILISLMNILIQEVLFKELLKRVK